MEIKVDLGDRKRKELAQAIGNVIGVEPTYKGTPSYAYEIAWVMIDRNADIVIADDTNPKIINMLINSLRECGFDPQTDALSDETATGLVIQLPLDGFTETALENLRLLVASKATLIKKAMGICDLTINKTEKTVDFPWFDSLPSSEEITVYTHFLTLLCDMAKRQTRVLAVEKPVESEKYSFRCFLLRLGMIGEQYAETRRILLRKLSGNGSSKNGNRKLSEETVSPKLASEVAVAPEPPPSPTRRFSIKKLLSGLKLMAMD